MARFSLVVACSENRVIGRDNDLPWRLATDLQFFKQVTLGKAMLMGRKTYDSIGRPLPGRRTIILTRDTGLQVEGCEVINDLSQLDALVEQNEEVMVVGGAQIYQLILPQTTTAYVTEVKTQCEGDAVFPELAASEWREIAREEHCADEKNEFGFDFVVYERSAIRVE